MRNNTTNLLSLTALGALLLTGCAETAAPSAPASSSQAPAKSGGKSAAPSKALTSAELGPRLLDLIDLGSDYRVKPESTSKNDDMAVVGCPALEALGSGPSDGSLDFPNQAKVSFAYASKDSDLSEEVYSDTEDKISSRSQEIFTAMGSCPKYQMVSGSTPIDVTVQKVTAPQRGDEQWGHILTLTAGGRPSVMKQIAVRSGNVLIVLSGSPALVDAHVDKALAKALKPVG
ncbi:hypothetical protein OTB20_36090 [Streptomyces sp. H27-H1]|uniref:hypothetical protein n=1 Tax=Streptomyces sp. H27-H1 TaxID=2996461 RepID=UPI002270CAD8|nr:hypothetical protein [Streptomyces sp. H27-H1]MCY0931513.1 hypothetical protein [Streptomyces sp. H27-H1]